MKRYLLISAMCCFFAGVLPAGAATVQQQVEAIVATADANGVITGKDGWLFFKEELEHLASQAFFGEDVKKTSKVSKKEFADPLPAIVDFNSQLKERGINLIFVPIPPKALLYPDKLPLELSDANILQTERKYQALYSKLTQAGVTVLDLFPVYQDARKTSQPYCRTDTHFSGTGIELAADELASVIQKNTWYKYVPKHSYEVSKRTIQITGDLTAMQKSSATESLSLQFVTDPKTGQPVTVDNNSPVLLLGDSHTLVFSVGGDLHSRGAGLFDVLSARLNFPLDRIGVRGSGATPSRIKLYQRSRKDSSFLAGKKTVIWCLSARELTGSGGWRKIPVEKK